MFIDVIVIKNAAHERENRIINANYIIQAFQPNHRENIVEVFLLNTKYPILVDSTLKDFKIKINQIKK